MIEHDEHVIVLHGDVDNSRLGELGALAADFASARQVNVRVDLAAVTYVDSTGVEWLVGLARFAERRSGRMRISNAQPQVRRILDTALPASAWDEVNVLRHGHPLP